MCPDWESNQWLFGSQARTQSTEPHQPGWNTLSMVCFMALSVVCVGECSVCCECVLCPLNGVVCKCQLSAVVWECCSSVYSRIQLFISLLILDPDFSTERRVWKYANVIMDVSSNFSSIKFYFVSLKICWWIAYTFRIIWLLGELTLLSLCTIPRLSLIQFLAW